MLIEAVAKKAPPGKVWKQITVSRGGKRFQQQRLVNAPQAPAAPTKTAQKAVAKKAALKALGPVQKQLRAGGALSPKVLAALPGRLAQLTGPELQAIKKNLGVKGGKTKADHVAKLVAHATAATQAARAKAAAAKPAPGPTKSQQKAAANAAAVTAVNTVINSVQSGGTVSAADLAALPGHLANLTVAQIKTLRAGWAPPTMKKAARVLRVVAWAARVSGSNAIVAGAGARAPVVPPPPVAAPSPTVPPPAATAPVPLVAPAPAIVPPPQAAVPRPGLWSRIWGTKPKAGASPAPTGTATAPPAPLYTGIDANGHHWVNGKQVAKPPEETHYEVGKAQPGSLNGVDFKSAPPKFWEKTADVDVGEPKPLKKIDRVSVMIQEPDGRIWIAQPTNGFGNRKFTMIGGGVEKGLTDQQNALKECWEETGLHVEITGHLGDFEDSNNGNNGRLYIARRIGGAPWDAKIEDGSTGGPRIINSKTGKPAAESEAVSLVTPEAAAKLLHRSDDLAQLMTVRPIPLDTPTSGKGSEPIKKFLAGIQPKALAYVAAQKKAGNSKPGNADLHAVQEMRGFNAKPKLVTEKDFDALVAAGDHIEMLRGVSGYSGKTADQLADQFRKGDHFPGHGCFGAGTYCDSTKGSSNAASQYAGGSGSLLRIALPKTAKIIKQSELEKLVPKEPPGAVGYGHHPRNQEWWGVQAALAGYDAIHVDGKSNAHGSYGKNYYVILNRGAVVVQETKAKPGYSIT